MRIKNRDGVKVLVEVLNEDLKDGAFKVPAGVGVIGEGAFSSCNQLTQVDLPPSVTAIGWFAFSRCTALTHINMPGVTVVDMHAFAGCSALTHVDMPNVTTIKDRAFFGCSAVASVNIPRATLIGSYAFLGCNALTQINMPYVTDIEMRAFSRCSTLTRVDMPSAITIGLEAFSGCSALAYTVLFPGLTSIGDSLFSGCEALTHIIINSDIDEEVEHIRRRLPQHVGDYVLAKSVAVRKQQAVKQVIDEFCGRCFELDTCELRSNDNGKMQMRIQPALPIIEKFLGKPAIFFQFEKEILKVPYPRNSVDLTAYIQQLQDIKKQYIARHIWYNPIRQTVICELEKYIHLLKKVHPDSFSAPISPSKESEQHQRLEVTLQKIIRFFRDGAPCILSAEEKESINKPQLLKIIPQEIQELVLGAGPAPRLVSQREAQENDILLDGIDLIVGRLAEKIQRIGNNHHRAYQAANELYTALRRAHETFKNQLDSGINKQEAKEWFKGWCTQLIAIAMPEMEKDRDSGWDEYFKDMLKSLANLLIRMAQKLGSTATFFSTRSKSSQVVAEMEQELMMWLN